MEEINFKLTIKRSIIFNVLIGLLLIFIFIILVINNYIFKNNSFIISLTLIFVFLSIIIYPMFFFRFIPYIYTSYSINDNEIIIESNFISKNRQVFRIDQITSVKLKQGLLSKILGVGTINIGIFGKKSVLSDQDSKVINNKCAFIDIKEYKEVYDFLREKLNVELEENYYLEKPFYKNYYFSIIINLIVFLTGLVLNTIFVYDNLINIEVYLFLFIYLLIFLLFYTTKIVKLKNTSYNFMRKAFVEEVDYFLGKSYTFIPYSKITNIKISKPLLKRFFNIADFYIYTGGDQDPKIINVKRYDVFNSILNNIVKSSKNELSKEFLGQIEKQVEEVEKPIIVEKAGFSYIINKIITKLFLIIFFIIFYLNIDNNFLNNLFNNFDLPSFFIVLFFLQLIISRFLGKFTIIILLLFLYIKFFNFQLTILYLIPILFFIFIIFVLDILYWNSMKYYFYEDKIIVEKGLFRIYRAEVNLKNIKYIRLYKSFLSRLFNQGDIYIFTAGTGIFDVILKGINKPNFYFKEIGDVITNK